MIEALWLSYSRTEIRVVREGFLDLTIAWKTRWFKTPKWADEKKQSGAYDVETSCSLSTGITAFARCSTSDEYSRARGQWLSLERALKDSALTRDQRTLLYEDLWNVFPRPLHSHGPRRQEKEVTE